MLIADPWRVITTSGSTSSRTGAIRFSTSVYKSSITASDVRDAIARESQLKKWSRAKKIDLINRLNAGWEDLGADVLQDR